MVDPIQGEYQKIQAEQYAQNPKKYKEEELRQASKLDPKKDAIAMAFIKMWGWPAEKALAAQKQYVKNILHECGHILDRYKHIFRKMREQSEDQ